MRTASRGAAGGFVDQSLDDVAKIISLNTTALPRLASEQRLYQLIRQPAPIADRQFEIEFLDSGLEAFSFTFG